MYAAPSGQYTKGCRYATFPLLRLLGWNFPRAMIRVAARAPPLLPAGQITVCATHPDRRACRPLFALRAYVVQQRPLHRAGISAFRLRHKCKR
jgi:hypothetical protein